MAGLLGADVEIESEVRRHMPAAPFRGRVPSLTYAYEYVDGECGGSGAGG